jgi:hypothetical protein
MKNEIQKLISELIAERAKANEITYNTMYSKAGGFDYFLGKESAFALCIQKLTLLLNAETQTTVKKPEA